ncbi:tetratricopeptide repeat protein [Kitasatospora sp. NPDC048239]|uniref:tetratricopeptide repeat protein n=1 Tax=Kitasatospora sp. NPDC048239 TaxID=3364046 RepID=UPI003720B9A9
MEKDRIVVVRGSGGPGSGYVIAPHLVLTSAHVVPASGGGVSVFRPGRAALYTGQVVWRGTPEGRDDAALVLVEDSGWTPPDGGRPMRWGRLATILTGTPCETWGAPDLVQRKDRPTDTLHPTGTLNPGDREVGNRYVMNIDGHPPAPVGDGKSPWGGISGAALFCGDLLTGVIAADPGGRSRAVLEAVPAYVLLLDPSFRAVLAEHGAGVGTVLEAVEWQHLNDTADVAGGLVRSPAVLLHARRQIVPFRSRTKLLEQLYAWSRQPGFGAYLLHGPGGQGKTRLAQHLTDTLTAERGQVLWLAPGAAPEDLAVLAGAARPLLVVVDYAETRTAQLLALLDAAGRHRGTSPFKLLLARTAGDWWENLQSATSRAEDLLDGSPVTALGPLEPEAGQSRMQAYREAVDGYARHLPRIGDWRDHDWPALADRLGDRPLGAAGLAGALTLHMTALADLLDAATGTSGNIGDTGGAGPTAAEVEDRLLVHERRYWTTAAKTRGLMAALSEDTLADALAAAFLLGAHTNTDADAVLRRVPALADQMHDLRTRVRTWITALYPPASNDRSWGLLQPDRLTERFIGRHLNRDPELAHHLATNSNRPPINHPQAEQLLTLYTRAATHPPLRQLGPQLTTLITTHPDTLALAAIDTAAQAEHATPLLDALQQITDNPATPVDDLTALADKLPAASHLLAPLAAHVAERLTSTYRRQAQTDASRLPRLAISLNNLGSRLGQLGQLEGALAALEEAVTLYRHLADARPDAHLPDLAASLHNLGATLAGVGRLEDALTAVQEAVTLYRHLATARPDAHLPDLALSVDNLGVQLGKLGRLKDALTAIEEVVTLRRGLADARPDAHLPDLAASLHNLGATLAGVGRLEDALTAIEEAVTLRRGLADARPDAHLPDLAASLHNLGGQLWAIERLEDALTAIEKAVTIYHHLATARPDAHLPDLAACLYTLAAGLGGFGRLEDALAAIEEAVTLYRHLVAARPAAHLPDLERAQELRAVIQEVVKAGGAP